MKKGYKLALIFLPLIFIIILILLFFQKEEALSADQKKIVEIFGSPEQFVISYLPRGNEDNPQLVREEVWFYPKVGKKISFLAGKLVISEDYQTDGEIGPTKLKPQDFEFSQSEKEVSLILGKDSVESMDYLPGFFDDTGVKTYYSEQAVFVIEGNNLTYFQTVGVGDKKYYDQELDKLDIIPSPTITPGQFKTYTSSDLGFEIKYPSEWFLEYGVLSSYDTGYLEKGLTLPDKKLKCDFNKYDQQDISIENPQKIKEGEITITKGSAKDNSGIEGPGFGDNILFVFDDKKHPVLALLCYSYNSEFEQKLLESFNSFKFID